MLSTKAANEFRDSWLPNASVQGLEHLLKLLDQQSPLLIRDKWTGPLWPNAATAEFSQGCLATQIAWLHPMTEHLYGDAGFRWLTEVAGIPAESSDLMHAWDKGSHVNAELAYLIRQELDRRNRKKLVDRRASFQDLIRIELRPFHNKHESKTE